jgi:hypothetical protein
MVLQEESSVSFLQEILRFNGKSDIGHHAHNSRQLHRILRELHLSLTLTH